MRQKYFIKKFLLIAVSSLLSCSGGGGGGSDGGTNRPSTGVRVIHAAIGTSPVKISVDGSESRDSALKYANASNVINIGLGSAKSIAIYRNGSPGDVLYSGALSVLDNEVKTVLLFGSTNTKVTLLNEAYPIMPQDEFLIRVINGDEGEGSLNLVAGGKLVSATFGGSSKWLNMRAGDNSYAVTENSGATVSLGLVEGIAGHRYSVIVAGKGGYWINKLVVEE